MIKKVKQLWRKHILNRLKRKKKKLKENKIEDILFDFNQNGDLRGFLSQGNYKYRLEGNYDELRLIKFIFKRYKSFEIWDQPFEKVNWEIPFNYKGVHGSFVHQKFGFRIYINESKSEKWSHAKAIEIEKMTKSALKEIQADVRKEGLKALSEGEIIVENRLREIEAEFNFFIKESIKRRKQSRMPSKISLMQSSIKVNYSKYYESEYLQDATYISFFSFIEHLCLLVLAFTENEYREDIRNFAKQTWSDKFKAAFPLDEGRNNYFYAKLVDLAKYRRNPVAHGYLDKKNTIFHFYLKDADHRIPMNLYDQELLFNLKKDDQLDLLKEFIKYIRNERKLKRIMKYLDQGFDISYGKSSLSEYEMFLELSERDARHHIEWLNRMEDDLANMDWPV